ncbi:MAG TPA: hypothetical protein VGB82_26665 [Alphaproteobacteria bacterium]
MFAPVPLALAAFAASGALTEDRYGPLPATPTFADQPRIEQPYRDGTRLVGLPYLDPNSADQACPRGYEIRRQETREDGSKVYLVWTLRCR